MSLLNLEPSSLASVKRCTAISFWEKASNAIPSGAEHFDKRAPQLPWVQLGYIKAL